VAFVVQGVKASTLLKITSSLPNTINDLVFAKGICVTIKKAFEF
jgi:hypothetical protein